MSVEHESAMKSLHLSWEDIFEDAQKLSKKLETAGTWKGMVTVTRGGLIPAGLIARFLDIRFIETLSVSSYDGQVRGDAEVIKPIHAEEVGDGEGWLVIDDLVDSGNTARLIRKMLPKAVIATLYAKPQGMGDVDHFIRETSQDTWIFYPWDGKDGVFD